MKLWIWHWKEGGYNSAQAVTRDEALAKARALAGSTVLTVDEATLHVGTWAELQKLDEQYASLFY